MTIKDTFFESTFFLSMNFILVLFIESRLISVLFPIVFCSCLNILNILFLILFFALFRKANDEQFFN